MRLTLDSNVLVYAIDASDTHKHEIAFNILGLAPNADVVLTAQALAEFLAVIGRKFPRHFDDASIQADRWAQIMPLIATEWAHVSAAAAFAARYRLQFWDSLIWQAARANGASILVSEDLQDGLSLEGMTVIDPFKPANKDRIAELLAAGAP